jgi:adenylate cyclase class 2
MKEGGLEVEVKLRVADVEAARSRIEAAGYSVQKPRVLERNVILDTAEQTLRRRGELLRIRDVEGRAQITYKGQARQGRHKTREELESKASDAALLEKIFSRIGFKPIFRYEKYRTEYRRDTEPGVITVDETPIGCFLELEGPEDWIDATAKQMGFHEADYILSSYATLYLEHCERAGAAPGDMLFPDLR